MFKDIAFSPTGLTLMTSRQLKSKRDRGADYWLAATVMYAATRIMAATGQQAKVDDRDIFAHPDLWNESDVF